MQPLCRIIPAILVCVLFYSTIPTLFTICFISTIIIIPLWKYKNASRQTKIHYAASTLCSVSLSPQPVSHVPLHSPSEV